MLTDVQKEFPAVSVLLLLVFLSACTIASTPDTPLPPVKPVEYREAGDFYRTLDHNGLERTYVLHVPANSQISNPAGLVIVLHGATGNADSIHLNSAIAFNEKADHKGFLVVYPDGTGDKVSQSFFWNAAHCCGSAWLDGIDDVGFIRTLIDSLSQELNLDPARIFVTGFSNGGMLAYRLAVELSDKIAAISPLAAAIGGRFSEDSDLQMIPAPLNPVPVLIFHGLQDREVPYNGGTFVAANGRIDLPVSDAVDFWVLHNGCDPQPTIETAPGGEYIIDTYSANGKYSVPVVLYTLRDVAHDWPLNIGESTATDIILDFFVSHPKTY